MTTIQPKEVIHYGFIFTHHSYQYRPYFITYPHGGLIRSMVSSRFTNTKQTELLFIFARLYFEILLCHRFNP